MKSSISFRAKVALAILLLAALAACGAGGPEVTQISFQSEGLQIGALLTKPNGKGPFPAYLHNHGSMTPQDAAGPLWSLPDELERQMVAAGYVVLRPARRGYLGSAGSTTTYWMHANSPLRAGDVINGAYAEANDVLAAVAWLRSRPYVDGRRIAVGGHSIGGLVSVIAAARSAGLAGVVSINGGMTWVYDGVEEGYPAVSKVWRTEAREITAPTLVLHGKQDAVVVPDIGRELAEVLQRQAVPVSFTLYDGDHHFYPIAEIVRFLNANVKSRR
jgi:dipeptidyl aminopeptidase/acylaminoacyl peptidase